MTIVLGSSSPWRQALLREMGYDFRVVSPDLDEQSIRRDDPRELVRALAEAKARAVAAKLAEPALVVAADQVMTHGGVIREKPRGADEARHFLRTAHQAPLETVSAVAVLDPATGRLASDTDVVRLEVEPIPDETIERLLEQGEVLYCAGGMRFEDPLLQPHIRRMDGTLDSVMGLPKALTERLLREVSGGA
ncbi:MAG: Maf family nucleotide pyrophosphatase [Armatimonadota bacterium]